MVDKPWFQTILRLILGAQLLVVRLSHAFHRLARRGRGPHGYVVGMEEIAGLLTAIGASLDDVTTVNLATNPLYDQDYDVEFDLRGRRSRYRRMRRLLVGPWVMGRLVARRRTFIYLGAEGFLISLVDGRDRELAYLRAHRRTVVCYFTGSDIRSQPLMNQLGQTLGRDVVTTYEPLVSAGIATEAADRHRRNLAASAERHAQLIFNAPVEQVTYLTRPTEPALYFVPDEHIAQRPEKWRDLARPLVVHAPTSPIIKGTPLVRAAVKGLHEQGFEFEYLELSNQPNSAVLDVLSRAHVVLGHFYQFIPGIVGLEAMASNCVLLTSADADIEASLPPGANEAWVVTPSWLIRENLERLLSRPKDMQSQADKGTAWVAAHCSRSVDRSRLLRLLAAAENRDLSG
ncbi:glycosyltransferase [Pedococcus sp. 2YAF34]|uniref:glycosyltransferase n=1 Tax=Pedococcus sp. 2YAF34 TaxID=3233032 RepID=UPI003F987423